MQRPAWLIIFHDGHTVAYTQSSWSGHLIDEPEDVESLRLAFDLLRDSALTPAESLTILHAALEEHTSTG